MNRTTIVGAIALGAIIAGAMYLNSADQSAGTASPTADERHVVGSARQDVHQPASSTDDTTSRTHSEQPRQRDAPSLPADPRLAALAVSPDNGLIEFVTAADGKVIAEIDKDPGSASFKKPLREYIYSGGRVVGLTDYRYLPDQIEITTTAVSYKPDGSVDHYSQSTRYAKPRR